MDSAAGKQVRSIKNSDEYKSATEDEQRIIVEVIKEEMEDRYLALGRHPSQVAGYEHEAPGNFNNSANAYEMSGGLPDSSVGREVALAPVKDKKGRQTRSGDAELKQNTPIVYDTGPSKPKVMDDVKIDTSEQGMHTGGPGIVMTVPD
ncbi:Hypothetical protein D9617_16g015140 [Elsinoe fawcettii]|nr:Hypothetical protein D9617_16g015140 [Elsinoe fawcettii]